MKRRVTGILLALGICAGAPSLHAQTVFDDLVPSIGDDVASVVSSAAQVRRSAGELSVAVDAARKQFWAQYPNGAQFAAAEVEFARRLTEKDLTIVMMYLTVGSGRTGQGCADPRAAALGEILGVTNLDGGIPSMAWLSFCSWIDAIRRGNQTLTGAMSWGFTATKLPEYASYKIARDWAEFHRAGKVSVSKVEDLLKSKTPERYILGALWGGLHTGHMDAMSFPVIVAKTQEYVDHLVQRYGREQVLEVARRIMQAPKRVLFPDPADAHLLVRNLQELVTPADAGCINGELRRCFDEWIERWDSARPAVAAAPAKSGEPDPAGGLSRAELERSAAPNHYALYLTWAGLMRGQRGSEEAWREVAVQQLAAWDRQYGREVVRRAAETIKAAPKSGEIIAHHEAEAVGCQLCASLLASCHVASCFQELLAPTPGVQRPAGSLPRKIKHVDPVYDPTPLQTRVPVVRLVMVEITVGTDGRVSNARVLTRLPPFDKAALDAVRQWQYDPAGITKPIVAMVTVPFKP